MTGWTKYDEWLDACPEEYSDGELARIARKKKKKKSKQGDK